MKNILKCILFVLSLCFVLMLCSFSSCDVIKTIPVTESEENHSLFSHNNLNVSGSEIITNPFINAQVGDIVYFGHYEQDNKTDNGRESIAWMILDIVDGKALVLSVYNLDVKPYNDPLADVTWETCTLRGWLNTEFCNAAFSAAEQNYIAITNLPSEDNPRYGTKGGNDTIDRIFALSIEEITNYFPIERDREASQTPYVRAMNGMEYGGHGDYWLRTPGYKLHAAVTIGYRGSVYDYGADVNFFRTNVRPAMWVILD